MGGGDCAVGDCADDRVDGNTGNVNDNADGSVDSNTDSDAYDTDVRMESDKESDTETESDAETESDTETESADERKDDDTDEDEGNMHLPSQFDIHFLSYSPSMKPPFTCCIPILCMANDEQLPVLMTSLLYQRNLWHINEPMFGIGFSKYETIIRLYVGWLGECTDVEDQLVSRFAF